MKTNLTNETLPLAVPLLRAANEDAADEVLIRQLAQPKPRVAAGWDPHEVWRTRILPYQRLLRAQQEIIERLR